MLAAPEVQRKVSWGDQADDALTKAAAAAVSSTDSLPSSKVGLLGPTIRRPANGETPAEPVKFMAPTLGLLGASGRLVEDEQSISLRNNADSPKKMRAPRVTERKTSQSSHVSSGKGESGSSRSRAQLLVRLLAARDLDAGAGGSGLFPYVKMEVAGKMLVSAPSAYSRQSGSWVWEETQVFSFEFRLKRLEPMVRIQVFDINTGALIGAVAVDFEIFVKNHVHKSANLWVGLDRDGRGRGQGGKLHLQLVYCPSGAATQATHKLSATPEPVVPQALPPRMAFGPGSDGPASVRDELRVDAAPPAVWHSASFAGAGASMVRDGRTSFGGSVAGSTAGREVGLAMTLRRESSGLSSSSRQRDAPPEGSFAALAKAFLALFAPGCLSGDGAGHARQGPRRVDSRSIALRRTPSTVGAGDRSDVISLSSLPNGPSRSLRI